MPHTNLVVVEIMRRRNFDASRTEVGIDVVISNHGDLSSDQGQLDVLTDKIAVARVIGVNRNRAIPEHRFRPGCRNNDVTVSRRQRITEMPKVPRLLFGEDLEV